MVFSGTDTVQTYVVPVTGNYIIEAAGAEGGPASCLGGRGARIKGVFNLTQGEVLRIVVGRRGSPGSASPKSTGGGGGGSFVWKSDVALPLPAKPILVAGGGGGGASSVPGGDGAVEMDVASGAGLSGRCGYGGATNFVDFSYSGGGGTGWRSSGKIGSAPTHCFGGSRWIGGNGANYCDHEGGGGGYGGGGGGSIMGDGSGGGGGYSGGRGGTQNGPAGGGGGSYNAGTHQDNAPGFQRGDGYVTIASVPASVTIVTPETLPSASPLGIDLSASSEGMRPPIVVDTRLSKQPELNQPKTSARVDTPLP